MKAIVKTDFNLPGQVGKYVGKVRDVYDIDGKYLVMVVTDRISAFDVVLPEGVPYKGQVLNRIAAKFLDATADILPNWKVAVPDPAVTVGYKCEPFKVEMVIRGYLAGHAWREYKAGKRTICGVPMPDGMVENQKFPEPLVTPTSKAAEGHDEDISKEEIIAQGRVSVNGSIVSEMGVQVEDGDEVIWCGQLQDSDQIVLLTDRGYAKRLLSVDFEKQNRNGKGVKSFYFNKNGSNGKQLAGVVRLEKDDHLIRVQQAKSPATLVERDAVRLQGKQDRGTPLVIAVMDDVVTAVDSGLIPTGSYMPVSQTPLDLREEMLIGDGLDCMNECVPMRYAKGYDCNYVLRKGSAMGLCACVHHEESGRTMEVITDQPGLQFYTACTTDYADGKGGMHYLPYSGLCLETQHYPDSPNHPNFPTTTLRPGEIYDTTTIYAFRVDA